MANRFFEEGSRAMNSRKAEQGMLFSDIGESEEKGMRKEPINTASPKSKPFSGKGSPDIPKEPCRIFSFKKWLEIFCGNRTLANFYYLRQEEK